MQPTVLSSPFYVASKNRAVKSPPFPKDGKDKGIQPRMQAGKQQATAFIGAYG
jgi:hypothetical protein